MSHSPEMIAIPAIVKAELLYGAEKSKLKESNMEKILEFLLPYQILPFADAATPIYASLRSNLEKAGNTIGPNDMIIASIVLSHGGILVTRNVD